MWDYDIEELKKTEQGRIKILERTINYGRDPGDPKIKLSEVKNYWNKLQLFPLQKRLMELLIWDEIKSIEKAHVSMCHCKTHRKENKYLIASLYMS